jgi:hypothetical protein
MSNTHGGARPGAGRKKGSKNRQAVQQIESLCEKYAMMPLDLLLTVLNDESEPMERRMKAAKAAAPYIHPRLAPVRAEDLKPEPRYSIDLSKLDQEELLQLKRIQLKAQVPMDDDRLN